jgi:DNA-binding MurR/RpiR family transcriptional regulator
MTLSPPLVDGSAPDRAPFADRRAESVVGLSRAEQRVARCLVEQKDAALLDSAATIAALAATSDATVVRAVRFLGFDGLSDLRQTLLADNHYPLCRQKTTCLRDRSVGVGRRFASLQFNRIGLTSTALSASGVALADRLLALGEGDAVLMIAYAPLHREIEIVIERARQFGNPIVLVSDSLGPFVAEHIAEVLRYRVDGRIIWPCIAARDRATAIASLESLSALRRTIDNTWLKRGMF